MYREAYSTDLTKKLAKLRRRDPAEYLKVRKKMDSILAESNHDYKFLSHDLKGLNRVHVGHFVLVFKIDGPNQVVYFGDYDHHDKIYR